MTAYPDLKVTALLTLNVSETAKDTALVAMESEYQSFRMK